METVRVIYHHEADGWWAESSDAEGWSAAGDTYAEVAKLAEEGIRFALERRRCPRELRSSRPGYRRIAFETSARLA
jgi:predicted RNase H-like HicB family nuclease